MLTFDEMRVVGISKMTMLVSFENLLLCFLESLVFQNLGHKQNMITVLEVAPFCGYFLFVFSKELKTDE